MGRFTGNIGGYTGKCRIDGVSAGNFEKVPERFGILQIGTENMRIVKNDYESR